MSGHQWLAVAAVIAAGVAFVVWVYLDGADRISRTERQARVDAARGDHR